MILVEKKQNFYIINQNIENCDKPLKNFSSKSIIFCLKKKTNQEKGSCWISKTAAELLPEYRSYIKLHIAAVILHHPFSLNPLIPTYYHPEEPLGRSVFAEPKILFTWHIYMAAHLAIMLQASWHIAEAN